MLVVNHMISVILGVMGSNPMTGNVFFLFFLLEYPTKIENRMFNKFNGTNLNDTDSSVDYIK